MLPREFMTVWLAAEALERELSQDAIDEARSVWGNTNTAIIEHKLRVLRSALKLAASSFPVKPAPAGGEATK